MLSLPVGSLADNNCDSVGNSIQKDELVSFQEITVQFPVDGWCRGDDTEKMAQFFLPTRNSQGRTTRLTTLALWPADIYPPARDRSRVQHREAIFSYERKKVRPAHQRWKEFVEQRREIGGKEHPTLSYVMDVVNRAGIVKGRFVGQFVLHFTDDLKVRHRFYVFMWTFYNSEGEAQIDTEQIDSVMSSLSIGTFHPGD